MAIAFDSATSGGALSSSPKTTAHTTSGSDRFLWVIARHITISDTVTGITYNGVAMTKATYEPINGAGDYYSLSMWYLANPATGSNNVVITTSSGNVSGYIVSYTGVAGGYDNSSHGLETTNVTSLTGTLTTVANNCWTVICASEGAGVASAGTNTTARISGDSQLTGDSNSAITPAGSFGMTITWSVGAKAGWVMGSMSPSAGGGGSVPKLLMVMGMGV